MSTRRIAIIGSGAVGGVFALAARRAGHAVTLCVRTPFDRFDVDTPGGTETVHADVVTDPARVGPVDWVVLTTKVQDVARTEPWLRALDSADVPVAVVQNGVEHRASVEPLGLRAPVLPTLIYVAAERRSPGRVQCRSVPSVIVPDGEPGAGLQRLLEGSGMRIRATEDFRTEAWRKMLTNLAANPITALTLRRLDVFDSPDARQLASNVLTEAVQVARAEGAALDSGDVEAVVANYGRDYSTENGTSMLYDRLAGLPTEHEHITAPLVEAARRHGIPVPHNETLLTLLRAVRPAPVPAPE
ncbi:2-dehydropantoate 2-reductase [Salinifilum ghardaiensis]